MRILLTEIAPLGHIEVLLWIDCHPDSNVPVNVRNSIWLNASRTLVWWQFNIAHTSPPSRELSKATFCLVYLLLFHRTNAEWWTFARMAFASSLGISPSRKDDGEEWHYSQDDMCIIGKERKI